MNTVHQMHQPPFLFYNPVEHSPHGHFSPHPNNIPENLPTQQYQQTYHFDPNPNQPHTVYHRPSLSGAHLYLQPKPLSSQPMVTPLASPRPVHQKHPSVYQLEGQHLSLDTACNAPDVFISPSTPPLSVTGSTTSSPPSTCGVVQTPVSSPFFPLGNLEGVKEGCEGEVKSEILAGGDWTRSCSPPLTPGTYTCQLLILVSGRIWNGFDEYIFHAADEFGLVTVLY